MGVGGRYRDLAHSATCTGVYSKVGSDVSETQRTSPCTVLFFVTGFEGGRLILSLEHQAHVTSTPSPSLQPLGAFPHPPSVVVVG